MPSTRIISAFACLLTVFGVRADASEDLIFQPIAGNPVPLVQFVSNAPYFIIELPVEEQAPDAMRLATLVETLGNSNDPVQWILNLHFKATTKTRLFIDRFPEGLRERIGHLTEFISASQLRIDLFSPEGNLLWSAIDFPSDKNWRKAVQIYEKAKTD